MRRRAETTPPAVVGRENLNMESSCRSVVNYVSARSRAARADLFRESFRLTPETRILDLGSEWGLYIADVLKGTPVVSRNVHAADIFEDSLEQAEKEYGFTPVLLQESERLPFPDGHFDIVFCNSVIEHVTLPKERLFEVTSEKIFRQQSLVRQHEFAAEIRRVGKCYFVQTPSRWFPLEPHTRLPFMGWMPRHVLITLIKTARLNWSPDWSLLTVAEMRGLFPDADIVTEKLLGIVKSIVAIKK
jgi:hypothetical protein